MEFGSGEYLRGLLSGQRGPDEGQRLGCQRQGRVRWGRGSGRRAGQPSDGQRGADPDGVVERAAAKHTGSIPVPTVSTTMTEAVSPHSAPS